MSTADTLRTCRMASSIDDLMSMRFWKAIAAEFTGTLFLVFVGCGSCISWPGKPDPSVVEIALTFGLGVGTMVWAICHVSGGHINPAVTVGMLATRKISLARALLFILAQCTGAIAGAGFLKGVTPSEAGDKLGVTGVSAAISPVQGVGVEFLITFVLVFTVFATCDESRAAPSGSGPLAIGLSVTFCHLFAIRYTGSSMNPARSLGPAVVMADFKNHWVYWVGPIFGGIVAALLYDNVFADNASMSKAKAFLFSVDYDNEKYEVSKNSAVGRQSPNDLNSDPQTGLLDEEKGKGKHIDVAEEQM